MVSYLQLAHNERHPVTGSPVAKVIHNFGRADQVDRAALSRLVASISRFLDPAQAVAAAAAGEVEVLDSRRMGGAWMLARLWERLRIGAAILRVAEGRRLDGEATERVVFAVYLRAKAQADAALQASDREWTILRPCGLTDDAGTGRVRIDSAPFSGPVSRDDVASVLARLLTDSRSVGRVLYLSSGAQPIEQALDDVLGTTERDAS